MDPQLHEAARRGDIRFLQQAFNTQQTDYFLGCVEQNGVESYNFVQAAVQHEQEEFLREALKRLPPNAIHTLLCHKDASGDNYNAFHMAAERGSSPGLMKLLLESYYSSPSSSSAHHQPWLAVNNKGQTPLHMALCLRHGQCSVQLLDAASEVLCNVVDTSGNSPLFLAVKYGCEEAALKILESNHQYSVAGELGLSPLDVAPHCSEQVCKLLLEKHPEMISKVDEQNGKTILHKWVELGKEWPFHLTINKDNSSAWRRQFINLMYATESINGFNPIHVASKHCKEETVEIVGLLVKTFTSFYEAEEANMSAGILSPWKRPSRQGATPLILALLGGHQKLALYYLSLDFNNLVVHDSTSVLFHAVENGCDQVVERILNTVNEQHLGILKLSSEDGRHVLHVAYKCTEKTGRLLVEKFPSLINKPDRNEKMPLDVASQVGSVWLVKLLLTQDPSSITNAPDAWIEACRGGHVSTIEVYINHCRDFRTFFLDQKESPLHHIRLKTYREYQDFLAIPLMNEMKNVRDYEGATPLHRAIESHDTLLAEALLTTAGVDRSIKNKDGKTAIDMLLKVYHKDHWNELCQRLRIYPLDMQFIEPDNQMSQGGGNSGQPMGEMRATLAVVAALLATLTFAAGFTLPGGFNQNTGAAIMPKEAVFIVFILADTFAMCCAMLVLFCLIWSMVCDHHKSLVLVDRSVAILLSSLYGTLVAFMTGIFTVISQKSLWAGILVIVMCTLVGVFANRTILFKGIDRLVPSTDRRVLYHTNSSVRGNTSIVGGGNSQSDITLSTIV